MATKLRPYQQSAIEAIRKEYAAGYTKQLITLPTGSGKTVVFSNLPEEIKDLLPGQMMVLLHREELADQAVDKLRKINPSLKIDKEMASHKADPSLADVVVAGVATLGRKGTTRVDKYNWPNFDKIVVDEAHRSIAQSYMNVYEAAGLLRSDSKQLLLGVTATPSRGDGQGLNKLYQKISYSYSLRQAIEDGYLVDIKGVRISSKTSLDSIKTVAGDFDQAALADTVNTPGRNALVLKAWLDNADYRITIGFGVDIAHSQALAEMFKSNGINAEAVWGTDPDRVEKIELFRAGKINVLFNAQLLVEGFDLDTIGCVILAGPTKSTVIFNQRVGRGTRLSPFKNDCLILDIVDASSRHSLITIPTLFGMSSSLDLRGGSLLASVKLLEAAQKEHPNLDINNLKDITKLSEYITETVNLFEVKFPQEVENNSEFGWHASATGGYILMLPNKDEIRINQNLLDRWEIKANLKGKRYQGERDKIEDVFSAADKLVLDICPESLKIVKREEAWHSLPPTPGQLKLIAKFFKGKQIPNNLTRGQASKLIGSKLAGKA